MGFVAIAAPILPGKTEQLKRFIDELRGPRHEEFVESRKKAGLLERTFLQQTPQGDLAIVTLEGDDPVKAFEEFGRSQDPFARWFVQQVKEISGIDLGQISSNPVPTLIAEGGQSSRTAGGSTEENRRIVRRFFEECLNQVSESSWNELTAPNYQNYGFGTPMDKKASIQLLRQFHQSFPDFRTVIDEIVVEGDRVMTRDTMYGTHKGDFQGIAATGKQVVVSELSYFRLESGKIVEDRPVFDQMSLMRQIGAMPDQQRRAA